MEQKEKTAREMQAEEQVRQAKARLNQIRREERAKTRKEQDHQKFILGGIVVKYFPEAYGFSVQEMCRILACAFKNRDIQNMIGSLIFTDYVFKSGTIKRAIESDEAAQVLLYMAMHYVCALSIIMRGNIECVVYFIKVNNDNMS